ncbi:MAG: ScpA family protein [Rhodobacteraceae bacterium]|nr:ScpA family protein [Paracoccaceae bacterium]
MTGAADAASLPEPNAARLVVDIDGYSGPLDLLLDLARRQRVDLREISMLQLVDQYLEFLDSVRNTQIEIAAEYLVMASWLVLLKSRTILPEDDADAAVESDAADLLAFQMKRLEAMRRCAGKLTRRPQLGRDFFARGNPDGTTVVQRLEHAASLFDLLQTYLEVRSREAMQPVAEGRKQLISVEMATELLESKSVKRRSWTNLFAVLPRDWLSEVELGKSALAATLAAALEMARLGSIEIRQASQGSPIMIRKRGGSGSKVGRPDRQTA